MPEKPYETGSNPLDPKVAKRVIQNPSTDISEAFQLFLDSASKILDEFNNLTGGNILEMMDNVEKMG
jgi:hypothetical protein